MTDTKLLIGIPSNGLWHADFGTSLLFACNQLKCPWTVSSVQGTTIQVSRNNLAIHAIEGYEGVKADFTHLLMLDDDMVFPPETIVSLLASCEGDRDIVALNYPTRRASPRPCGWKGRTAETSQPIWGEDHASGLELASFMPTGTMMIQTKVLKEVSRPWFQFVWDDEAGTDLGEDFYFCAKAMRHGFTVYCDMHLSEKVIHQGEFNYTLRHARLASPTRDTVELSLPPERMVQIAAGPNKFDGDSA